MMAVEKANLRCLWSWLGSRS